MKLNKLSQNSMRLEEMAFKRGYQHGWLFALQAIDKGATTDEALAFALKELQDWRYGKSYGRSLNPPAFGDGR